MNRTKRIMMTSTLLLMVMGTGMRAQTTGEDEFHRKDPFLEGAFYKVDVYGIYQYLDGDNTSFGDGAAETGISSTHGGGFGLGINLTDHMNVNTEFIFTTFDSDSAIDALDIQLGAFIWNANLDFNLLKSRLTPVISGGLGFFRFDNDTDVFVDGQGNEYTTEETNFSWNVGAGLRWDVTNQFLIKAMYRINWTQFTNADDHLELDGLMVGIGATF